MLLLFFLLKTQQPRSYGAEFGTSKTKIKNRNFAETSTTWNIMHR
jgi:hypothetical protein